MRFHLAQANLNSRFPAVAKDLHNTLTLARKPGECNRSFACDVGHARPLRGSLLDYCTARKAWLGEKLGEKLGENSASVIDVSVHDGDVSHGLHDLDELHVINAHCKPAIVNMFNTYIHPTHKKMVRQLDADPAWRRIAHSWVPFEHHFKYKNRTFHAYASERSATSAHRSPCPWDESGASV